MERETKFERYFNEALSDISERVKKQPGFSLHDHVSYEDENRVAVIINYDPTVNGEDTEITYVSYVENERTKSKYTRINEEVLKAINHYMPSNVDTEIIYFHGEKIIYIFKTGK